MPLVMNRNETFYPVNILCFCADAVVFDLDLVTDLIKQFWGLERGVYFH